MFDINIFLGDEKEVIKLRTEFEKVFVDFFTLSELGMLSPFTNENATKVYRILCFKY